MIALAKSGIVSNSNYPLTLGFKFGAVISLLSIIGFVVLIVLAATHTYTNLVAWLFPTIGLLFGSKMTIDALTNLYIGKIYDEVKNRPEYIVSDKINID
jgi:dolichol-phosphate mannosyltransferase